MPKRVNPIDREWRLTIGAELRRLREEQHIPQKKLALHMGFTASQLCRIERGQYQGIGTRRLLLILRALSIEYGAFFRRVERKIYGQRPKEGLVEEPKDELLEAR